MPIDDRLHRGKERFTPRQRVEGEQHVAQVSVPGFLQLVMEKDALLEGSERINILNVVGAPVDADGDLVDFSLREANQRQQVGCDRFAGENAVGLIWALWPPFASLERRRSASSGHAGGFEEPAHGDRHT